MKTIEVIATAPDARQWRPRSPCSMNTMVVSVLLVKTVAGSVFGEGDEDDDRHQTLVSVMSGSLLRLVSGMFFEMLLRICRIRPVC